MKAVVRFAFILMVLAQASQIALYKIFHIAVAMAALIATLRCLERPNLSLGLKKGLLLLAALSAYNWLSSFWSLDPAATTLNAAVDTVWVLGFFVAYITAMDNDPVRLARLIGIIPFGVAVIFTAALAVFGTLRPEFDLHVKSLGNICAMLLIACIPICVWLAVRPGITPLLRLAFPLTICLLLLAQSRAGILVGVAITILSFITLSRNAFMLLKRILLTAVPLGIIVCLLLLNDATSSGLRFAFERIAGSSFDIDVTQGAPEDIEDFERKLQYVEALAFAQRLSPIGLGYMSFSSYMDREFDLPAMSIHSSHLAVFVETGLIGFAIYSMLCWTALRACRAARRSRDRDLRAFASCCMVSLIGVLAMGLFHQTHQNICFYLALAWSFAALQKCRVQHNSDPGVLAVGANGL